mmetsp:Transcript_96361/g.256014  ORF Transcript_96361/g.256014 Transcript_96361/m.256014 type:complete len:229 (+) Transcript_96361:1410-2096(+)
MTRKAVSETPWWFIWANRTSLARHSGVTILSLLSSKTLSFFKNCIMTMSNSSLSLSSRFTSSCAMLLFTIFFSTEISSAKFRSTMMHTSMSLLCRVVWALYFFSSFWRSFLSSFVALSPSCWSRMVLRSMSSFRTWLRWHSYSSTRMVTSPHWCCMSAGCNCEKCEKQRKVQMIPTENSKLFFEFSLSSRLRTPRKVSWSARRSRLAGSVQTRRMHFTPWTFKSMCSS